MFVPKRIGGSMGYLLMQGNITRPLLFLMIDSTDHLAGKTGLSPTVTLSKNGGGGGAPAGAVTQVDAVNHPGWYKVAPNATDANTLGPLALHATAAGADPSDELFEVVDFDPETAANIGMTNLDATVSSRATPADVAGVGRSWPEFYADAWGQ